LAFPALANLRILGIDASGDVHIVFRLLE